MNSLVITRAGLLMTIQDSGRRGYGHLGVPESGPMDWFAYRAANRLVGNPDNFAVIEWFAASGATFTAKGDLIVAITGVSGTILLNGETVPFWTVIRLRFGDMLVVSGISGNWCYLSVAGGLNVPSVLGSTATCLVGQFGGFQGRHLQDGDAIPVNECPFDRYSMAGLCFCQALLPEYGTEVRVGVIPGPQANHLPEKTSKQFFEQRFIVESTSNRTGYRLKGDPLMSTKSANILSEGVVVGAIQVPASGQPIILMADHQSVGGYPVVGCVCLADLPLVAQLPFESGMVYFENITVDEALERLESFEIRLKNPLEEDEPWSLI